VKVRNSRRSVSLSYDRSPLVARVVPSVMYRTMLAYLADKTRKRFVCDASGAASAVLPRRVVEDIGIHTVYTDGVGVNRIVVPCWRYE